jgi:hypothetical protein
VELFRTGGKDVYLYDVNSLYPFCMTKEFPGVTQPCNDITGYGCADVTVQIPEQSLCPLPHRMVDGRIQYPWGKFRGVWTFAEIQNAIENHEARVLKIHSAEGTSAASGCYREFVETLYANRLKAKSPAESLFWKLLLNNLYGQLAVSGEITRTLPLSHLAWKEGAVQFGQKILAPFVHPLPLHTNYLHAAYVTAYGRIELLKFLGQVHPDKLIYCDTDSILCIGPMPDVVTSTGLGLLKLELHEKACDVFAPKTYHIGERWKAKGVPKRFARQFIETGRVEYEQPFRYREAVQFYDRANSRQLSVWRKVSKIRVSGYLAKRKMGCKFTPKRACAKGGKSLG